MGRIADEPNADLSNSFTGQVPLVGELGWHITPAFQIGGYLGMAIGGAAGAAKRSCEFDDSTCVALGFRFGLQLELHPLFGETTDPWLGYGIGLEVLSLSVKNSQQKQTQTLSGLEFGHFMGGVDFRVGRRFGIGPMVDFAVGRYSRLVVDTDGVSINRSLPDQASHQWLTFGVRGTFYP